MLKFFLDEIKQLVDEVYYALYLYCTYGLVRLAEKYKDKIDSTPLYALNYFIIIRNCLPKEYRDDYRLVRYEACLQPFKELLAKKQLDKLDKLLK